MNLGFGSTVVIEDTVGMISDGATVRLASTSFADHETASILSTLASASYVTRFETRAADRLRTGQRGWESGRNIHTVLVIIQ